MTVVKLVFAGESSIIGSVDVFPLNLSGVYRNRRIETLTILRISSPNGLSRLPVKGAGFFKNLIILYL